MPVKQPFSPAIMAQFSPVSVSVTCAQDGKRIDTFLRWSGTYSAFLDLARAAWTDNSPAGRRYRKEVHESCDDNWAGTDSQSPEDILKTGVINSAFEAFKRIEGKLEADRFQPSHTRAVVSGPVWITPQVLAGNARPARMRERTKLPPKNLSVSVCVEGEISHEAITASVAKIARASWDYIEAGGAVTLTINYVHQFHTPRPADVGGIIVAIRVPLTNQAAFASACSAQLYRALSMPLRDALQGVRSAPVVTLEAPGVGHLKGQASDAALLAGMGVR